MCNLFRLMALTVLVMMGSASASAVASNAQAPARGLDPLVDADPFPSTYKPRPSQATAIVNATILTAAGQEIEGGSILMRGGRIAAVGTGLSLPADVAVINGRGKWVTPGIIDPHSHVGLFGLVAQVSNSNESTMPVTGNAWVEHGIWSQAPSFFRDLEAGVTTMLELPGSTNLIGGRAVVIKNVPGATIQERKFPNAPVNVKMACGENPYGPFYGRARRFPSTLMGNIAALRAAFIEAAAYRQSWEAYRTKRANGESAQPPRRDFNLDTIAGVLDGRFRVQVHCYRSEDMAQMIDLAKEFDFQITAFHHATEAYKIAPLLAREKIATVVWGAETGGGKLESYDYSKYNAAVTSNAEILTALHSDEEHVSQQLHSGAGRVMANGAAIGLPVSRAEAIKMITINPARIMGIDSQTGSLEPGKMADVVVWNHDPFSIYAQAEQVFIDGALTYDRHDSRLQPESDLMLGR